MPPHCSNLKDAHDFRTLTLAVLVVGFLFLEGLLSQVLGHGVAEWLRQRYGAAPQRRADAAFDAKHGWFWRNRTDEAVTITLTTSGNYEKVEFID